MFRLVGFLIVIITSATRAVTAAEQPVLSAEQPVFTADEIEFFETHIRPLLVANCYECHSTDAVEVKAELYVDSRQGLLAGGESGPAIVLGDPNDSLLVAAVKYETTEMPPDNKLNAQQIEALVTWVEMGAPWPTVTSSPGIVQKTSASIDWAEAKSSHWAWQPIQRPEVPNTTAGIVHNPIDSFVIARRNQAGLPSVAGALPHVLARRIYVDLVGIPPTPEQVTAFCLAAEKDQRSAIAALVDELLASPAYGERWGRHWLDVARYSDGYGGFLDNKALHDAWRYRDWVVHACNDDLPINRFLQLQVAGDLIGDRMEAVATGFFALGPTYNSDGGDPDSVAQARGETLDDRIDTLTRGLLGITGSCARCHDHKFDPIPQQDYYSLAGVFNNTAVHSLPLASPEAVARFDAHNKTVGDLKKRIQKLKQKKKSENGGPTSDQQQQLDEWTAQLDDLQKHAPPKYDTAHALKDSGNEDMKVAIRGNLRKTGELAPRRFLRVLSPAEPQRFTAGSGRQELAEAITDPLNPLTARVFVNRVWMHHFGHAIVRTPSNFGTLGEKPTHPQLLDWLAAEFIENGWSLKSLHRLIMTSATYQLSSDYDAAAFEIDGDNRLLWRMSPRRMDVEAWRDSLLAVTGELDISLGGPPRDDITSQKCRTLYAKVSRNGDVFVSDAFLRRFDFPLMRATVAKRPQSIVPQQFLFLMNSRFMVERAKQLAARLHDEATSDAARIARAYQLLYSRQPTEVEFKIGTEFVTTQPESHLPEAKAPKSDGLSRWQRYAQVLLSANEFMYVR